MRQRSAAQALAARVAKNPPGVLRMTKRLLREAFRLDQQALPNDAPAPYDFVIVVRAHEPLSLGEYRSALAAAVRHLHSTWTKRHQRQTSRPTDAQVQQPDC